LFSVVVETHFWSSHRLTLPSGAKEPLHRHNWAVTAQVASSRLNDTGLVMDFRRLRQLIRDIVAELDNEDLRKLEFFRRNNPSAENVAKFIYEELKPKLPEGVRLDRVRVVEEPGCSAEFGV